MRQGKKSRRRFLTGVVAALVLILLGIVMMVWVFTQYGQIFMDNQDGHLLHLAQSVDRNIANLLDHYGSSLDSVTERPDFQEAQEAWLESGESGELLTLLEKSLLDREDIMVAVLVMEGEQVRLSTDGSLEYAFLSGDSPGALRPCVGGDGRVYLALSHESGSGLTYAALLDPDLFYDRLASRSFTERNWILLTDTNCRVLLYRQQERAYVDRVDAVTGATSGQEGVEILLEDQRDQRTETVSYEYFDALTRESYTARMAVVPSGEGENGTFAVAVVANFQETAASLNAAAFRLVIFGCLVVVGIIMLVAVLVSTRRKDERELAYLRRKNEQMEELNRKTRELAHHQRLETIGTMTSSIAHEFNNLLTPIMGYSIMVLEKIPPEEEEICDDLLEIYQASQKAKTIISRLSDLSRKNAVLTFQAVAPDDLARKVLEVAAPARPPKVEAKLEAGCPGLQIHGKETQLSQLLLNLVLNSFHAMEEAGGTLRLTTEFDEERIYFRVADTGCGIPEEVLPNIFDPFFTTKESGKGTGLGLAIVQQVAEEHGGRIGVESRVGEGTVITASFPIYRGETPGTAAPEER